MTKENLGWGDGNGEVEMKCQIEIELPLSTANRLQPGYHTDEDVYVDDQGKEVVLVGYTDVDFMIPPRTGEDVIFYPDSVSGSGLNGEHTIFAKVKSVRHQTVKFKETGTSIGSVWVVLNEVKIRWES